MRFPSLFAIALLCGGLGAPPKLLAAEPSPIRFNRDIRPILSDNCFFCHGPDKNQRKGRFRLDDRDSAMQKGAIIPGDVEKSPLVQRIFSNDSDELMPPAASHKSLSSPQKLLLKEWIAQGAPYEPFWAYMLPQRPAIPVAKNAGWVRNPIDAFILAALETRELAPVDEADRRTLLRRLSLDLTGLPPTPEEVSQFVNDTSPNAYEKQVDRLLASPHYGERMAVPWLDAVRFADTVGFHGDQNQNVFPYRDYVINAFNSDKPFDQFTIEQFAGDLLAHPTAEQLTATGFDRLNMMTREGGAQAKEYLAKYAADRVRTLGSAFLGSTLACCECHDHKFDPFSTKDFYSLESFWADVRQWGIYTDYAYTPNPDLPGFTNDHPFPPEIVVDSPYLKKREQKLLDQIDQVATATAQSKRRELDDWEKSVARFLADHPDGWLVLHPDQGKSDRLSPDGVTIIAGKPKTDQQFEYPLPAGTVAEIRLEAIPSDAHGGTILLDGKAGSERVELVAAIRHNGRITDTPLGFEFADADRKAPRYSSGYEVEGIVDAWMTQAAGAKSQQTAIYVIDHPVQAAAGDRLTITLKKNPLGAIRVSVSPLVSLKPINPSIASSLKKTLAALPATPTPLVARTMLLSTPDPADNDARSKLHGLIHEVMDCRDGKSPTLVVVSQAPRQMRVLHRGNWQDETGEIVMPSIPHFLQQPAAASERRLTRLDLARWLVSKQNPLTARTITNRFWKQFMGVGICNTVEDLGSQGDPPSNPELLDWLAVEFQESGWDVKHVIKLIVMSSAYRESSNSTIALRDADPFDRLSGSQLPRRLDAEFVRDNALAAAGLLNLDDIGGPSVFPYQPAGYYANIQFPDRPYYSDTDDRQYRRGVYVHWQRTFLHPMLNNFDAPSREDSTCTRNVSNTPLQALTLLNDPSFVEAARVLAEHAILAGGEDAARLDYIYSRVLCRDAGDRERESLAAFLADQRTYYRANAADAAALCGVGNAPLPPNTDKAELAAWTSLSRVVLNLHESITRY